MLYPKGYYRGRAIPSTYGMGENDKGEKEVGVAVEFTQGEHAGGKLTWKGGFGVEPVTSNGKSKNDITFETLIALGMTNDDLDAPVGLGSTEVEVVVDHYTFADKQSGEQKTVAQIRWINAPSGPKFKNSLDVAAKKSFANTMKASMIAFRNKSGMKSPATAPNGDPRGHVSAPIGDDDAPF